MEARLSTVKVASEHLAARAAADGSELTGVFLAGLEHFAVAAIYDTAAEIAWQLNEEGNHRAADLATQVGRRLATDLSSTFAR